MKKRRRLSLRERECILQKMDGRCAYCGIELELPDMQVDHVVPLDGWAEKGTDTIDNMFPSCRSCNNYKRASSLNNFRKHLENMPNVLMRDSVTYKNAVRFGLVVPNQHKVVFYFERVKEDDADAPQT